MSILTDKDVKARLTILEKWHHIDNTLVRDYELLNFDKALAFINKIGELANNADHHPDIKLHVWNKVQVVLSTHSAGGLTDKDFALANAIEQINE